MNQVFMKVRIEPASRASPFRGEDGVQFLDRIGVVAGHVPLFAGVGGEVEQLREGPVTQFRAGGPAVFFGTVRGLDVFPSGRPDRKGAVVRLLNDVIASVRILSQPGVQAVPAVRCLKI